jgi:hypothetical protein
MTQALSIDEFQRVLPTKVKKSVNAELMNQINTTLTNPEEFEAFRDNLVSYTNVMREGKFKVQNYIDAVKYVSFKLMGDTNILAYSKTFPSKITRFTAEGVSSKDIASYCTAYNKSKLVNLIYEQTLIPSHVLNADMYQKALNVQAELMKSANSEKVRTDAANSILTHLKRPESQKVELNIGLKETSEIQDLRAATQALVAQQREMLQTGNWNAKEAAHSKLVVDGEYEEID